MTSTGTSEEIRLTGKRDFYLWEPELLDNIDRYPSQAYLHPKSEVTTDDALIAWCGENPGPL